MRETIYALSTGVGRSALAIIRVCGPTAGIVLQQLSRDKLPEPRRAVRRKFYCEKTGNILDDGLALWFPSPNSFNGEDLAELHIHGGQAIVSGILNAVGGYLGTRLAEPGEFTKIAFLNNKMDLTVAEGICDLIEAETEAQRRQAQRQASGMLGRLYDEWRIRLMNRLAHIEAAIDFPDEELPKTMISEATDEILCLEVEISQHLDDNNIGERLRNGVEVAIVGPPNVGKSSLLNWLAGRDAAIVSDIAGTTRDVLEVRMDLAGFPVIVCDTAGLRDAEDCIEAEGICRAIERASKADIRVMVFDANNAHEGESWDFDMGKSFAILNKIDLCSELPVVPEGEFGCFKISCHTGEGIDAFISALSKRVSIQFGSTSAPLITRRRHREAIESCLESLTRAKSAELLELMAEDLRLAMRSLGAVTGAVDVEDLLDIIFRDFCIGK